MSCSFRTNGIAIGNRKKSVKITELCCYNRKFLRLCDDYIYLYYYYYCRTPLPKHWKSRRPPLDVFTQRKTLPKYETPNGTWFTTQFRDHFSERSVRHRFLHNCYTNVMHAIPVLEQHWLIAVVITHLKTDNTVNRPNNVLFFFFLLSTVQFRKCSVYYIVSIFTDQRL